jgi:outer membrane lipoprotein SlyB
MKTIIAIIALIASFGVSAQQNYWGQNTGGGSSNWQGNTYNGQQAMQVQQVRVGQVLDIRAVQIVQQSQGTSYGGATLGAALGGLAGNQMGKGNGKIAATMVMAALGGVTGESIGTAMNTQKAQALEIIVRMESGEVLAITQAIDQDAASLRPGDKVRLIQSQGWGGTTRVTRMHG